MLQVKGKEITYLGKKYLPISPDSTRDLVLFCFDKTQHGSQLAFEKKNYHAVPNQHDRSV